MAELIVAFDLPSGDDARRLADRLPNLSWAKLGPMLLLAAGPDLIRDFRARGVRVFLDLKWHDIPHTVAGAVRAAAQLGVELATVHGLGGTEMLRGAVAARNGMRLAGVSVLTSHTPQSYAEAVGVARANLQAEVQRVTRLMVQAGMDAVVTSPEEIEMVRAEVGTERWIVVPGIRPPGAAAFDQRRTGDPAMAVAAGATHLVVGRPITDARDPRAVYEMLCDAIA